MEQEKNLVQKISLLKDIQPKSNWVLYVKTRILADYERIYADAGVGHESLIGQTLLRQGFGGRVGHLVSYLRYLEKPAFVLSAMTFLVLGGVGYQVSQNSLPGDALYSLRSAIERATMGSDPLASLEIAQRRLEDLKKVVEGNKVRNLSSATQEFNQSVETATKGFLALVENEPKKALQVSRELVQLQRGKTEIEQTLGASLGEEENSELQNATRILVEMEFADLTTRTLSAEQEELFKQAVSAYKEQRYEQALEYVWLIANNAD